MIEDFIQHDIFISQGRVMSSKNYRKQIHTNLESNQTLLLYLNRLYMQTNSYEVLFPSFFVIDTFQKHNLLPVVKLPVATKLTKEFVTFSEKYRDNYLKSIYDSIFEKNEFYASLLSELSQQYEDPGNALLVYKFIETQNNLDTFTFSSATTNKPLSFDQNIFLYVN